MRLELEPSVTSAPVATDVIAESNTSADQALLKQGIAAAQAGDRAHARTTLMQVVDADPRNESAWLWLASISEYPEELLVFLENILDINPQNQRAVEWMAATKSLLAKTFIQRGIDAAESGQTDFAFECFNQGLEHDQSNSTAWLWMASLSDSPEGKLAYLEQALAVDPDNESAQAQFNAVRAEIIHAQFARAKAAAVTGNPADAHAELAAVLEEAPDLEEAWIFKSHLDGSFENKIETLERALTFHPDSVLIRSSLESLRAIVASTTPISAVTAEAEPQAKPQAEPQEAVHAESEQVDAAELEPIVFDEEIVTETHPTQDLELPTQVAEAVQVAFSGDLAFSDDPQADESAALFEDKLVEAVEEAEAVEAPADLSSNGYHSDIPVEATFTQDEVDNMFEAGADFTVVEQAEDVPAQEPIAFEPVEMDCDLPVIDEYIPEIPMPHAELPSAEAPLTGYETVIVQPEAAVGVQNAEPDAVVETASEPVTAIEAESHANGHSEMIANEPAETACAFCSAPHDAQTFRCSGCSAVMALSDIDTLLKNEAVDKDVLKRAVDRMESDRVSRPLNVAELITLGIGHLNLRNYQYGYERLNEAVQLNPNDIMLASQVNALHIRIEEIRRHESQPSPTAGKRILIVDDSPTIRKLISGKLEKSGHEVLVSADGVEAIEMLQDMTPDLILLDITMPRMDGYQVCKMIRGNDKTKDVPVVMISGKDGFFDKVRGRMAGSSGYITKPFGPETLMKAVETYLTVDRAAQPAD